MSDENRDLDRLEAGLTALALKVDDLLRIIGKVEPFLENIPKLQEKVQQLEVQMASIHATQSTDLASVKQELKENRFKALLQSLGSAAIGGGAVAAIEQLVK